MAKISYFFCILDIFLCQMCLVHSSCIEENSLDGYIEDNYIVNGSGEYQKCWNIKNPEKNLHIKLESLNLQNRPASDGSLTIELKSESRILTYWSLSRTTRNFTTTSSENVIRFKVNSAHYHRGSSVGFKLHFKKVCDKVYTELSGNISSPYYPDPYPNNALCTYAIKLSPGYLINMTFHDVAIENHTTCGYDYLEVYNGDKKNSDQRITKLCGDIIPEPIISTYNDLWMEFRSDSSNVLRGFRATYRAIITDSECALRDSFYCTSTTCVRANQVCNGIQDCDNGADEYLCNEVVPLTAMPTNGDAQEYGVTTITQKPEENLQTFVTEDFKLASEKKTEELCTCANETRELVENNSFRIELEEHKGRMEVLKMQKKYETDRIEFQRMYENERLKKIRFEIESLKLMFAAGKAENANQTKLS